MRQHGTIRGAVCLAVVLTAVLTVTMMRGPAVRGQGGGNHPGDQQFQDFDRVIDDHAATQVTQGRQTFRHDTFGDEAFWGDTLQLHKAIEGSRFGGVGPGVTPREALIAGTEHGIFMQTNRSWSIDDKRYNFQFGCEIGWEIKGGKRVRMVKNPSYSGITTEFWNSLDAICSRDEWTLWGTPNCGKGQPQQVMGTGHGAAPSRFRGIKVGSAFKNGN